MPLMRLRRDYMNQAPQANRSQYVDMNTLFQEARDVEGIEKYSILYSRKFFSIKLQYSRELMPRYHEMVEEFKKKRIAANGYRLPDPIRDGEVLTDIKDKKWRIGKAIGLGGFGEIYLASDDVHKPVNQDAKYVVKVEPHSNGPLFVEMNFYIRAAQPEMIQSWMKERKLKFLGMPCYISSGSHEYKREKYRFLVMNRFGKDLSKVFVESKKKFHLMTVLHLGIQIINVLEYVHSKDYIHADIKGSNLLLGEELGRIYLVDFGLATRYRKPNGKHKEYGHDERRAHEGTPEFTSRDAHIGAHSRRGDLEILGYNMLQWLCSELPWEGNLSDMEYVHLQKKTFMSNIPAFMWRCFPDTGPPDCIEKYFRYVSSLDFETQPDYSYCRELLRSGMKNETFDNNGKLLFGLMPVKVAKNKRATKRKANEEPENRGSIKKRVLFRNVGRKPCVPQNYNRMTRNSNAAPVLRSRQNFSWEKVLSGDPEVLLKKKSGSVNRKAHQVAYKISNQEKQIFQENSNSEEEMQENSSDSIDISACGIPTPAMLEVLERRKALAMGQPAKKWRNDSVPSDPSDILTPAMEEVMRRRKIDLTDSAIGEQEEDSEDEEYTKGGRRRLRMKLRDKKPMNMCEWMSSSSSASSSNVSVISFSCYAAASDYSSISYSSVSTVDSDVDTRKKRAVSAKASSRQKCKQVTRSRTRYNLRPVSERLLTDLE
ncbi:hypothetical protein J437_LFUL018698 [Ladona fulva]|uniref:non-specific serine/threonine protein kinase n=1 Tax=Ladona fulva TaxID=123851 RepID=A0A8K0KVJ4_LADFU|nr:hypothetical protein J437_LFUL018698 [Ladona fulva]